MIRRAAFFPATATSYAKKVLMATFQASEMADMDDRILPQVDRFGHTYVTSNVRLSRTDTLQTVNQTSTGIGQNVSHNSLALSCHYGTLQHWMPLDKMVKLRLHS